MRHDAARNPDPPDTDAALAPLVARAAGGDESAWEALVHIYGRRIYAMAKSRLRDAESAEEITQSVFATLAAKLRDGKNSRYEEIGKFEPWLFRITMNRVRDEGRRRQRRAATTLRLADTGEPDAPSSPAAADPDDLDAMRRAVEALDGRDREIIELRHHASLSFAQIAESLGEPMGTVLARHHRALKKLRQRLESGDTADAPANSSTDPASGHAARHAEGTRHA